jgi:hypothetical protein
VVYGVVPYLALNSGGTGELRELGEEVVDECATIDDFDAGHRNSCGLCRCEQCRDSVEELVAPAVDEKSEVRE